MTPGLIDRQLRERLAGFDCISFDVFDTAVVRLVGEPRDVFGFVAAEHGHRVPGLAPFDFVAARVAAERLARQRAWADGERGDVTLDEIYAALTLPPGWDREALRELELETEARLCRAHQPTLALYREAQRLGKRIIFLSDMYLPAAVIGSLLERAGYDGPHRLFVSSEAGGRTKALGDLYPHVLAELGLAPGAVLHIGDNHRADFWMAARHGIATHHVERVGRRAFGNAALPSPRNCQALQRGLVAQRLFAHEAPVGANGDAFWYRLGYEVAGVLLYGFVRWLCDEATATGVEHVYMLARDGYIVQQAYERLRAAGVAAPPSSYLYASRRALNLPAITAVNDDSLRFLASGRPGVLTARQFLERAGLDGDGAAERAALAAVGLTADERAITPTQWGKLRALFVRLEARLLDVVARERPLLMRYFAQEGLLAPRPAALVDIGWHGSLQRAIDRLVSKVAPPGHLLHGFYLGTFHQAQEVRDGGLSLRGYLLDVGVPAEHEDLVRRCVEIFEFFHGAPHGSTIGFEERDGRIEPRLAADETAPAQRAAVAVVQRAALDFIDDFLAAGAPFPWLTLARETAVAPIERLLLRPTREEAAHLGDLTHADGYGDAVTYWPLARPPGLHRFLREPGSLWREYQLAFWREGYTVRLMGSNEALRRLRASLWQGVSALSALKQRLPSVRRMIASRLQKDKGQ